jgi:hypothetical protein
MIFSLNRGIEKNTVGAFLNSPTDSTPLPALQTLAYVFFIFANPQAGT